MKTIKTALAGHPNTGKTSLFNRLTGLRQRVGNYPGITVEKKTGKFTHHDTAFTLYDLPGTYSLYPSSADEEVAFRVLSDPAHADHPDRVIVVADAANLRQGLLLFFQVRQLGVPVVLAVNMIDTARKRGILPDKAQLSRSLGVPVVFTDARKGEGIDALKDELYALQLQEIPAWEVPAEHSAAVNELKEKLGINNSYRAWQLLAQKKTTVTPPAANDAILQAVIQKHGIVPRRLQVKETLEIYRQADAVMLSVKQQPGVIKRFSSAIDRVIMHPFLGYVVFFALLLLVFQAIFAWSELPMAWIENGFGALSETIGTLLPDGPFASLVTDGIIPGIGGIVVFVPQIVILFFCLLIMEETGYMSRVVYLMDRWMRPFGLHGKSVVPLMSGAACAIPAVMSARNIENSRERLITVLVTPFMTCAARLPVYALLISIIIPDTKIAGFSMRGFALMGMYLIGLLAALFGARLLSLVIKSRYKSYLIMEIPSYKIPSWKNVFTALWEKTSAFVFGAGKIILAISIVLWVMAFFGPASRGNGEGKQWAAVTEAAALEDSYLGITGKIFEPALRPLGYDWKIGVGIVASFAAREVFVPTMATIYSISYKDENAMKDAQLEERMRNEIHPATGKPVYTMASGISLLLFYAFAMMCMSTVAAVKRETGSWKWALLQLGAMTLLAYLTAFAAYQILK